MMETMEKMIILIFKIQNVNFILTLLLLIAILRLLVVLTTKLNNLLFFFSSNQCLNFRFHSNFEG